MNALLLEGEGEKLASKERMTRLKSKFVSAKRHFRSEGKLPN
jgi:hypothetical protein